MLAGSRALASMVPDLILNIIRDHTKIGLAIMLQAPLKGKRPCSIKSCLCSCVPFLELDPVPFYSLSYLFPHPYSSLFLSQSYFSQFHPFPSPSHQLCLRKIPASHLTYFSPCFSLWVSFLYASTLLSFYPTVDTPPYDRLAADRDHALLVCCSTLRDGGDTGAGRCVCWAGGLGFSGRLIPAADD